MKKIIIILATSFIPFLFFGCTKADEGIITSNTEQILTNLKGKYDIDYQRVDTVSSSSIILSLADLQAFFNDFEKQSSLLKSRIAAPELYDANSIEMTVTAREYGGKIEIMGRYKISKHLIGYRFLLDTKPIPPKIKAEYIMFDRDEAGIYDQVIETYESFEHLFYVSAGISILTSDALGVAYRVNWNFHISGHIPVALDIDLLPQEVKLYLSKEDYSERKI